MERQAAARPHARRSGAAAEFPVRERQLFWLAARAGRAAPRRARACPLIPSALALSAGHITPPSRSSAMCAKPSKIAPAPGTQPRELPISTKAAAERPAKRAAQAAAPSSRAQQPAAGPSRPAVAAVDAPTKAAPSGSESGDDSDAESDASSSSSSAPRLSPRAPPPLSRARAGPHSAALLAAEPRAPPPPALRGGTGGRLRGHGGARHGLHRPAGDPVRGAYPLWASHLNP